MRPEYGEGTSTTALAVSTATIGWSTLTVSPTLTCQRTISASARPSPRSGRLNVAMKRLVPSKVEMGRSLPCQRATNCVRDARDARDVLKFLPEERHDGVIPRHALDRRLQVVEAVLGHVRGNFRTDATVARRLVHDDEPTGFCDGLQNGVVIDRRERGEIDHFAAHAVVLQLFGRAHHFERHRAPGDERDVLAFAQAEAQV